MQTLTGILTALTSGFQINQFSIVIGIIVLGVFFAKVTHDKKVTLFDAFLFSGALIAWIVTS